MVSSKHVVHAGAGTLAVCVVCCFFLGLCIIGAALVGGCGGDPKDVPSTHRHPSRLPNGEIGAYSQEIIEKSVDPLSKEAVEKYGPVNPQALMEEKSGRILDAIRARRSGGAVCRVQSPVCVPCQSQAGWQWQRSYSSPSRSCVVSRSIGVSQCPSCVSVPSQVTPQPARPATTPRVDTVSPTTPYLPVLPDTLRGALPLLPDGSSGKFFCPDGKCPLLR